MWYRNIHSASFSFVAIQACDTQMDRITTPKTALAYACVVKIDFTFWLNFGLSPNFGLSEILIQKMQSPTETRVHATWHNRPYVSPKNTWLQTYNECLYFKKTVLYSTINLSFSYSE